MRILRVSGFPGQGLAAAVPLTGYVFLMPGFMVFWHTDPVWVTRYMLAWVVLLSKVIFAAPISFWVSSCNAQAAYVSPHR